MKILQVIDSLRTGGAENLVTSFLVHSKYKQNNITNEVCVLYTSDSFLKTKLGKNNIPVYSLNLKCKYDIRGLFRLVRLIRKGRYDMVHVHLFPAVYFCALASLFTGNIKFIYTEHSTFNRRRLKKVWKLVDRLVYGRYEKVIAICRLAESELLRHLHFLEGRTTVIYNGIPLEEPVEREKLFDILLIGSLREAKAVDVFIKAVHLIRDKVGIAAIAGDGALREELTGLRDTLGLHDKIMFLGIRPDVCELLEHSKIFVLSSRWEGVPISILEAMSKAKPIVCTKVGGMPEIIDDSCGILVNCNEIDLAEGISRLFDDPAMGDKLGQSAYEKVRLQFSIDKYSEELERVYLTT